MDYCTSCRRHLNGALVCPGCGAYAPDIAPATIDSRVTPGLATGTTAGSVMIPMPPTTPAAAWGYEAYGAYGAHGAVDGGWHDGPAGGGFTAGGPADGSEGIQGVAGIEGLDSDVHADAGAGTGVDADGDLDVDVDVEGVPVAPRGRAARRRQLARWKKNQRRAVVATAVALVGGGLTVMGMDRQSTDRTQAATAPDAESLGSVEEQGSQRGRTSATETDDARRTSDAPTTWTPSGDTTRDRSAASRSAAREDHPNAPRTASATPSAQQARTGSAGPGETTTDDTTATPTDETTTLPATDDSGSSSADTDTDTGTGTDTETGSDSGSGTDSGSDTGTGTGTSDGSGSDTATTSPSGLCLLGIVCVS